MRCVGVLIECELVELLKIAEDEKKQPVEEGFEPGFMGWNGAKDPSG